MITQTVCWVVRCDVCGNDLGGDDGEEHFPTREAASRALDPLGVTMTVEADGRIECNACRQKRLCRTGAHQWVSWWRAVDEATVARSCLHCSITEHRDRTQVDPDEVRRVVSLRRIGNTPR